MTSRRSSMQPAAEAFKIYTEITDVGKTVGGTKKKIRWSFGIDGESKESEVVLVHSIVSGKKVRYKSCFINGL